MFDVARIAASATKVVSKGNHIVTTILDARHRSQPLFSSIRLTDSERLTDLMYYLGNASATTRNLGLGRSRAFATGSSKDVKNITERVAADHEQNIERLLIGFAPKNCITSNP